MSTTRVRPQIIISVTISKITALAAANAVILLIVTLMMIWGLTRVVDIRQEL